MEEKEKKCLMKLSEFDDEMMEKFLEGEDISEEEDS